LYESNHRSTRKIQIIGGGMNRRLRALYLWLFLGLGLVSLGTLSCQREHSNPLDPDYKGHQQTVLSNRVKVPERYPGFVDAIVLGGSLKLIFQEGVDLPTFNVSDIVIGTVGGGFLKEVTGQGVAGDTIILLTRQSSLGDAVIRGSIDTTVTLVPSLQKVGAMDSKELSGGRGNTAPVMTTSEEPSVSHICGTSEIRWPNVTVEVGGAAALEIDTLIYRYSDATMDIALDYALGLKSMLCSVKRGDTLEAVGATVLVDDNVDGLGSIHLGSIPMGDVIIETWGIPILLHFDMDIDAGLSALASLSGSATASFGIKHKGNFTAGAEYNEGTWSPIWYKSLGGSGSMIFSASGSCSAELEEFLTTGLKGMVCGTDGIAISVSPYLYEDLSAPPDSFQAGVGANGEVDVRADIFETGMTSYHAILADYEKELFAGGGSEAPGAPDLYTPTNGDTISDSTPTFVWSEPVGAAGYQIQVNDDTTFASPEIDELPSDTTYTASPALGNGTHYWRVRAKNGLDIWGGWSGVWAFTIGTSTPPPEPPTLYAPPDGDTLQDNTPTFVWSKPSLATQYEIQVDGDTTFSSPVLDIYPSDTTYTAASPLADGAYYWRVRAGNASIWSNWSDVWSFTVLVPGPLPPVLYTPADGETLTDNTPTFVWSEPASAAGYEIQVDNDSAFGSPAVDQYPVDTAYTLSTSLSDGVFFWRVRAKNSSDTWGGWSVKREFMVVTQGPPAPILISPADGDTTADTTPDFIWGKPFGATGYVIQVDDDTTFITPVIELYPGDTTITPSIPLAYDDYHWRVKAKNILGIWGNWSDVWAFTIRSEAPAAPLLYSPADAETLTENTPTLIWGEPLGAAGYELQVDYDTIFSTPLIDQYPSDTFYTPIAPLADSVYYWRARAKNAFDIWGDWSGNWMFTVITKGPDAPVLYSPADQDTVIASELEFIWGKPAGAVDYEIQVDIDTSFAAPLLDEYPTDTSYTPASPPADTTFYWRVRARNAVHIWGAWSEKWSFTSFGYPHKVITDISVPGNPSALAILSSGSYLYSANSGGNSVSVIRTSDNTVTKTVGVGKVPRGIAILPPGVYAYVSCSSSDSVFVIRTLDNTVVDYVPVGSRPEGVAALPNGNFVYVADWNNDDVSVIQTSDNSLLTTVSAGDAPNGITVLPNGNYIYVANWWNDNVTVIKTADNSYVTSIFVQDGPRGITSSPDGQYVYVTNSNSNEVSVIKTATNGVTANIPVLVQPSGVASLPNSAYVFVTNTTSNKVSVIRTSDRKIVGTIQVGASPYGVVAHPNGKYVYVANNAGNTISVIGY
jgi:YVTN family beta-propeller protein